MGLGYFVFSMIKYFLNIGVLLTSSAASAQFIVSVEWQKSGDVRDTIYYNPDRKLEWDDFRGAPASNSVAAAITESGFGYRMTMKSVNGKTNVNITVLCYFNKRNSWVKPGMNSDYALTHEQHHFDITYINACLFIQKLKAAHFTSNNYEALADQIHDECYEALGKMQDDYDGQTMNGRLPKVQLSWNKKIDKELSSLITN